MFARFKQQDTPSAPKVQEILDPDIHSITEIYSPHYRSASNPSCPILQPPKESFQHMNQEILEKYSHVNLAIDQISICINNRMNTHEEQLLGMMRKSINQMMAEVQDQINKYRAKMIQNNIDEEIQNLQAQIEYFKHEALTLLKQKKELSKQIIILKEKLQEMNESQQTNRMLLKKMKVKLLKQKYQSRQFKAVNMIQTPNSHHKSLKTLRDSTTQKSKTKKMRQKSADLDQTAYHRPESSSQQFQLKNHQTLDSQAFIKQNKLIDKINKNIKTFNEEKFMKNFHINKKKIYNPKSDRLNTFNKSPY